MQKCFRPLVFLLCLAPLGMLFFKAVTGGLGVNPIETLTHVTGEWALRLLLITLAITPVRKLTRINGLIRYRRMLGLFTFFYVCLHFSCYLVLDHFFDWAEITRDIIKRPYITVGFMGFVLLIPLAMTSTNNMIQRLGANRWRQLHRLVYITGLLGVLHFMWLVKADLFEPLIYAIILLLLLLLRLPQLKLIGSNNNTTKPVHS